MTAPQATISTVSTAQEPYVPQTDEAVVVRVCEPFQVYFDQTVFVGGDLVTVPAEVATRYTLARWVELAQ